MNLIYFSLILFILINPSSKTYTSILIVSKGQHVKHVDLKEYEGTYSFQADSPVRKFIITSKENEIFGEADSYGANKLIKQAEADTFLSTSTYGSTVIFTRDATTKKVSGLRLIIQGTTLEATRDN
jgi:hypothetical protein